MNYTKGLVSIIVPCWNGEHFIGNCFSSAVSQTYKNVEFIVVDNNSSDASLKIIREKYGGLNPTIIVNASNYGFAKAMNQGIAISQGEFILALNMDVIMEPDYIEKLVRAMSDEKIGSATGKLYRFPEDFGGKKIIDSTGHILLIDESVVNRGEEEEDDGRYDAEKDIFGVCAAAGLYRRNMLENVKLGKEYFDEDFFVSFEDVDLDWRAVLGGWRSVYVPQAVAFHKRYGTNWPLDQKLLINSKRNKMLLVLKNDYAFNYLLNFPFVFAYGLEDILYNHFKNYRLAIGSILMMIAAVPWALRKRFKVKKMRRISSLDFRKNIAVSGADVKKLFDVLCAFLAAGILAYFFGIRKTALFLFFVLFVLNPAVYYAKKHFRPR